MKKSIVVGYDGSDQSRIALQWAAAHAVQAQQSLHLVHCWIWPLFTDDLGPVEGITGSGLKHSAEAILAEGAAEARRSAPELDLQTSLVAGVASTILARLSRDACLLVVGSRGLGGFMGLLVGSVSLNLASTAECPVVVVRSQEDLSAPVLIGVDGSAKSDTALDDAITLAEMWDVPLTIMHVRDDTRLFGHNGPPPGANVKSVQLLTDAVGRSHAKAPDLAIESKLVTSHSVAGALLDAASSARIVVVGETGKGNFIGAAGSTAQTLLHHAKGNILISRRPRT